jgi:hypothetical protein
VRSVDIQDDPDMAKEDRGGITEGKSFFLIIPFWRSFLRPESCCGRVAVIIIAILCALLAVYQIYSVCALYTEYPVTTNTKLKYEQTAIPEVSICTNARINATRIAELDYGISNEVLDYMLNSFLGYSKENKTTAELEQSYEELKKTVASLGTDLETFYLENGFKCDGFIDKCQFSGEAFDCCGPDTKEYLISTGKCFSITPPEGGKFVQKGPGRLGGLSVELRNRKENFPTLDGTSGGVEIRIGGYGSAGPVERILAAPGTQHDIQISKEVVKRLLSPYGDCNDKGNFSVEQCTGECLGMVFFEKCACTPLGPHKDMVKGYGRICAPNEVINCVNNQRLAQNFDPFENCECKLPCDGTYLSARTSSQNLNSPELSDKITLDVYYPHFMYRLTEEVAAFSFAKMMQDIGISIMLFTGLNLLTILLSLFYCIFGFCMTSSRVNSI